MTENEIKAETRIMALEFLVLNMYNWMHWEQPEEAISAFEYRMLLGMDQIATGIIAPAGSERAVGDAVSHLQDAISSLQSRARRMRETVKNADHHE